MRYERERQGKKRDQKSNIFYELKLILIKVQIKELRNNKNAS